MTDIYTEVAATLMDLRAELHRLGLWQDVLPSATALASQEPFCLDTLDFNQWVQFVFMPRIQELIDRRAALPLQCGIAPMVEEFTRGSRLDGKQLISLFVHLDNTLSNR